MNILLCKSTKRIAEWLLDRAEKVYLILDDFDAYREIYPDTLARMEKIYYISSFDSIDELAAVAVDLKVNGVKIDRIATFTEFSQYGAGYLAKLLGVRNYSTDLALNTRDKRQMKQLVRAAGLRTAAFASISNSATTDIEGIETAVGYPLVIKPVSGLGTMSTKRIEDRAGLVNFLASYKTRPEIRSRQLIAEEYISGEELHIDAIWRDGKAWMLYVGRYFVPWLDALSNGGINGSMLLNESDYANLYAKIACFHDTLNAALGIRDGATHLEVFWDRTTGELTFSEIATRCGGGGISYMIGKKCGFESREVWVHELCGKNLADLNFRRSEYRYVCWFNLKPRQHGVITALPDQNALSEFPGVLEVNVLKAVGDHIHLHHPSEWCVLTVLGADSEEEIVSIATDIFRRFQVEVDATAAST